MLRLLKDSVHALGRRYISVLTRRDWKDQDDEYGHGWPTERAVEYAFVFQAVRDLCPRTILDVGTGTSALPSMLRASGAVVDAIDQVEDYWGTDGASFNRHWHIQHHDIRKPLLKKYDMITCISVLEHIPEPDVPMANMLDALNPDGVLLLCGPYNEQVYVPNAYDLPEAGYGKGNRYVCQQFSRAELSRWVKPPYEIEKQEYWKVFEGPWWTMGRARPRCASATDMHHHSCVQIRRRA
jgi:SAM-dependent methyltransferase